MAPFYRHMWKGLSHFLHTSMWRIDVSSLRWHKRMGIQGMKIVYLSVQGFNKDQCSLKSSALTFLSSLAIVPALVMLLSVSHAFGFDIKKEILDLLKGQETVLQYMFEFADKMLARTRGDIITVVGLLVLFFTVMRLMHNIEDIFNSIWSIHKHRSLQRKFADYTSILVISPIIVFLSSSLNVFIRVELEHLADVLGFISYMSTLLEGIVGLIPYTLLWFMLTMLYTVMPNTQVRMSSALLAGILSGTSLQFVQWAYITFQLGVSNYNAIYGSLAALPLFLVWLFTSWIITLFGAELAYAHQNLKYYETPSENVVYSSRDKKYMAFVILKQLCKAFQEGKATSISVLTTQTHLSIRAVEYMIGELKECRLVVELNTEEPLYQPSMGIANITPTLIIERLEDLHTAKHLPKRDSKLLSLLKGSPVAPHNTPISQL